MVEKERSDRSASPIEMVYLAKWIAHYQPALFIESGSDIGYSAECICEALDKHVEKPLFYTVEPDPARAHYTRTRLERFPFATSITDKSDRWLKTWPRRVNAPVAFFIDGPKGVKMLPVFCDIMRRFTNIQFIAIHDCYEGGQQREVVIQFFAHEYLTMFTGLPNRQLGIVFVGLGPVVGKRERAAWQFLRWVRHRIGMALLPLARRVLR